eukprot:scaffold36851_cov21-Tisochrysis_lutea.AAC.1
MLSTARWFSLLIVLTVHRANVVNHCQPKGIAGSSSLGPPAPACTPSQDRLDKELERNLALRVEAGESADSFVVSGRGMMHLGRGNVC